MGIIMDRIAWEAILQGISSLFDIDLKMLRLGQDIFVDFLIAHEGKSYQEGLSPQEILADKRIEMLATYLKVQPIGIAVALAITWDGIKWLEGNLGQLKLTKDTGVK